MAAALAMVSVPEAEPAYVASLTVATTVYEPAAVGGEATPS